MLLIKILNLKQTNTTNHVAKCLAHQGIFVKDAENVTMEFCKQLSKTLLLPQL